MNEKKIKRNLQMFLKIARSGLKFLSKTIVLSLNVKKVDEIHFLSTDLNIFLVRTWCMNVVF